MNYHKGFRVKTYSTKTETLAWKTKEISYHIITSLWVNVENLLQVVRLFHSCGFISWLVCHASYSLAAFSKGAPLLVQENLDRFLI